MRFKAGAAVLIVTLLSWAGPALAHHSFAAMYDASKPVVLKGTVTSLEFRNPHIWLFVDVPGDKGTVRWGCEGGNPNSLVRQGWKPDAVKAGDQVTVDGYAGRDGKPVCNMRNLAMADGKKIFIGTVNDGAPR